MPKRAKREAGWAWVSCAGGADVLAWLDPADKTRDGWVVPWLPDAALANEHQMQKYFEGAEDRQPYQDYSGRWVFPADPESDDEDVELPRVRRRVRIGTPGDGGAGKWFMLALSDSAPIRWDFEVADRPVLWSRVVEILGAYGDGKVTS